MQRASYVVATQKKNKTSLRWCLTHVTTKDNIYFDSTEKLLMSQNALESIVKFRTMPPDMSAQQFHELGQVVDNALFATSLKLIDYSEEGECIVPFHSGPNSLRKLTRFACRMGGWRPQVWQALSKLSDLTSLRISMFDIHYKLEKEVNLMGTWFPQLTHLNLSDFCGHEPRYSDFLFTGEFQWGAFKSLRSLNLKSTLMNDERAVAFAAKIVECQTLEHIDLSMNSIGETGTRALAVAVRQMPYLLSLNLHRMNDASTCQCGKH